MSKLQTYLIKNNISKKQLKQKTNLSPYHINQLLKPEPLPNPSIKTLRKLSKGLNIPLVDCVRFFI